MAKKKILRKIQSKLHRSRMAFSSKSPRTGYLRLPNRKNEVANRNVRLCELLEYQGPDIYLNLSESGLLLGIEVLIVN